jgi:hypothetical protein
LASSVFGGNVHPDGDAGFAGGFDSCRAAAISTALTVIAAATPIEAIDARSIGSPSRQRSGPPAGK